MACISETSMAVRFFGDDLSPEDITLALGKAPTSASAKDEVIVGKRSGDVRTARTGKWIYGVDRQQPGNLNAQIHELFSALTADLDVWRRLAAKYQPDLFVGLFLNESNEGIEVSVECLEILAARGVSLSLDVYALPDD